jgi:membrane-bound lytic murein transglycosylase
MRRRHQRKLQQNGSQDHPFGTWLLLAGAHEKRREAASHGLSRASELVIELDHGKAILGID